MQKPWHFMHRNSLFFFFNLFVYWIIWMTGKFLDLREESKCAKIATAAKMKLAEPLGETSTRWNLASRNFCVARFPCLKLPGTNFFAAKLPTTSVILCYMLIITYLYNFTLKNSIKHRVDIDIGLITII